MENHLWILNKDSLEVIAKPKLNHDSLDNFFLGASSKRTVLSKAELAELITHWMTVSAELPQEKAKMHCLIEGYQIILQKMQDDDNLYVDGNGAMFVAKKLLWFEDDHNAYLFVSRKMLQNHVFKSLNPMKQIFHLMLFYEQKQTDVAKIIPPEKVTEFVSKLNL